MKYSWYRFCMNTNIWGDFQICVSVPLINTGRTAPADAYFKECFALLDTLGPNPNAYLTPKNFTQ